MAKARSASDRARPLAPPPLVFAAALAAGWALERARPSGLFARQPVADALLAVAGLALMLWAAVTLARARTTVNPYGRASALVTGGPYRFSRNPIYVADALLCAGVALALGWAWALALVPLAVLVVDVGVIRREEAHLAARFGDEYAAYRARVRRWV